MDYEPKRKRLMKMNRVIAIYSPSGGGKTTIVTELAKQVPNSNALYFDDRDYDSDSGIDNLHKWYKEGADVNRFNLQALAYDIELLQENNTDYIFLDYPFGYRHKQIGKYINQSIFVDTPLDIALARRLLRDFKDKNADEILNDVDFYLKYGRDLYIHSGEIANKDADFIVDGSLPLNEIIKMISNKIKLIP